MSHGHGPADLDERALLDAFVDEHRAGLRASLDGLTDHDTVASVLAADVTSRQD